MLIYLWGVLISHSLTHSFKHTLIYWATSPHYFNPFTGHRFYIFKTILGVGLRSDVQIICVNLICIKISTVCSQSNDYNSTLYVSINNYRKFDGPTYYSPSTLFFFFLWLRQGGPTASGGFKIIFHPKNKGGLNGLLLGAQPFSHP
jgi:hypothetical protein